MATLARINLPALMAARDELLAHDLIAHETRIQVLALPPPGRRRCQEPGGGLMQLGELFRRASGLAQADGQESLP